MLLLLLLCSVVRSFIHSFYCRHFSLTRMLIKFFYLKSIVALKLCSFFNSFFSSSSFSSFIHSLLLCLLCIHFHQVRCQVMLDHWMGKKTMFPFCYFTIQVLSFFSGESILSVHFVNGRTCWWWWRWWYNWGQATEFSAPLKLRVHFDSNRVDWAGRGKVIAGSQTQRVQYIDKQKKFPFNW